MITDEGKLHIKRYLAGFVPSVARSIAFGVGGKSESAADTKLQFEVGRVDITLTSYDFVNDRVVYKAELPEEFGGTIYEAAIFSEAANNAAGQFGSRVLATFDSETETWVDFTTSTAGTYTTGVFSRIDTNSLTHTPAASQTKTDILRDILLEMSGYSGADKFVFAYNVGNANTSNIQFRFYTDTTNYFTFSLGTQTAGYKVTEVAKSTAVATGTPTWDSITSISVATVSAGTGASQVQYDGIRIEDTDTVNTSYVMVARELLPAPVTKQEGKIQEIEFALDVNVL